MSNLTSEQVKAITHAWLSTQRRGDRFGRVDSRFGEVAEALEQAFPWLLRAIVAERPFRLDACPLAIDSGHPRPDLDP